MRCLDAWRNIPITLIIGSMSRDHPSKMVAGTACSDRVDCRCSFADYEGLSPETVLAVAKSPFNS